MFFQKRVLPNFGFFLIIFFLSHSAFAQLLVDGPPQERLVLTSYSALRASPFGMGFGGSVSYRERLYKADSIALSDNYFGFGLKTDLDPATARGGLLVEFSPLTMVRFWFTVELRYWQPLFGISSTGTAEDDFLNPRDSYAENPYPTYGAHLTGGVDFQAKLGPIAARLLLKVIDNTVKLKDGDLLYFDDPLDAAVPAKGFVFVGDLDVFALFGPVYAGLRLTTVVPVYDRFILGKSPDFLGRFIHQNGPNLRVGPILFWTLHPGNGKWFQEPSLAFIAQWHLLHRYRTGLSSQFFLPPEISQAVPYAGLAFTFWGDLLAKK